MPEGKAVFFPALARGLDYYTGPVYETYVPEGGVGSLGGGGRYDNLIGALGGRDLPATGISVGLERLLVVMEERGMAGATRASRRPSSRSCRTTIRSPPSISRRNCARRASTPK